VAQDRAGTLTCFAGSVIFGIVTAMTTRIHSARLLVVAAFVLLAAVLVAIEARRAFRDVQAVAATSSVQVESVGRTVRREVLASAVWLVVPELGSAVLEQPEFGLALASVATPEELAPSWCYDGGSPSTRADWCDRSGQSG
jgi:hypothetical protein